MKRVSTVDLEKRNDLHLTSTGIGHALREFPYTIPPVQLSFGLPLPHRLVSPPPPNSHGRVVDRPTVRDVYLTSTAAAHGFKQPLDGYCDDEGTSMGGVMGNSCPPVIHKKAPGHWKTHYVMPTLGKLEERAWARPLTMGQQCSEVKDNYQGLTQPPGTSCAPFQRHLANPVFKDHFTDGPSKEVIPSTQNKPLLGRPFLPSDQGILHRNEPYMTTNNWYHRPFGKRELNGYPKKDVATYWLCEDYPKAWGHGTCDNPLSKRLVRTDPGPGSTMRDRTVFRTRTQTCRVPEPLQLVSRGMESLYASSYAAHPKGTLQNRFHCPVKSNLTPLEAEDADDTHLPEITTTAAAPNTYTTVNSTYGNGPTRITVW